MKHYILSILCITIFISCTKSKEEGVLIRVKNETATDISDVRVYSFSARQSTNTEKVYGVVGRNDASAYLTHEYVYDTPLFSYGIPGGGSFSLSSIYCITGVNKIDNGRYTLLIQGDPAEPQFRFIKD